MKTCENCIKEFQQTQGVYNLDFGFVCFNCYEEIREVFDTEQYLKCKDCEKELTTTIEMEYEICSKCLINSIERSEQSCFQLDY